MSGSTRPFLLILAEPSVLRRARELGIARLENQVEDAIHEGRKKKKKKKKKLRGGLGKLAKDERSVTLQSGHTIICRKGVGLLGVRRAFHCVRIIPRRPARRS